MKFFFGFLILCFASTVLVTGDDCLDTQAQTLSNPLGIVGNSDCRSCCSQKKVSYVVGTEKVPWFDAYVLCKHNGMELASITSLEEEFAVENYTKTTHPKSGVYEGYWIAGTRSGACGTEFVWLTTGKPVLYRNFAPTEPNGSRGVEDCVEIFVNDQGVYAWNDAPCSLALRFICQSSNCHQ